MTENRSDEVVLLEEIKMHLNLTVEEENPIMISRKQNPGQKRLSLFDFEIQDCKKDETTSKYEEFLSKEAEEWVELLDKKKGNILKMKDTTIEIDNSILTEEQKVYFKNSFDYKKFREESREFCQKANAFLQEYSNLIELYSNLSSSCESLLENNSYNIMSEFLL